VAATGYHDALRHLPVSVPDVDGVQTVDASHGGVVFRIMPIATALVAVMITMSARGRCSGSPPLPAPQS
jgi:hypothetical protein